MKVFEVEADGPPISSGADVLGLIYDERAEGADWIAVPAARFEPSFFDLRSGLAADVAQKVVNYRARLAITGDISAHLERSKALRDFVREANRGTSLRFVADAAELA